MDRARIALLTIALSASFGLGGCGGGSAYRDVSEDDAIPEEIARIPDAVPKVEPRSKFGNPDSYVVFGKRYYVKSSSKDYVERGLASWYGKQFHGRRTSSGESYDMDAMTAAHKTLPLPTYARVTNLDNGRSVVVRINDRGPFHDGRVIDLSRTAAIKLGVFRKGTAPVEVQAIDPRRPASGSSPGPFLASAEPSRSRPRQDTAARRSSDSAPSAHRTASVAQVNKQTSRDQLYLQVGAFGSRINAERLRARLTSAVANPVRIESEDSSQLYKVRVGPLVSRNEANALSARIVELGIDKPHLVQN